MTEREFSILRNIAESQVFVNCYKCRYLQNDSSVSEDDLQNLKNKGWISEDHLITEKGLEALAPYRVDNAIILAAGMSTRFAPLSYERPKGLTTVKGEVVIERQIRQLIDAGVSEIVLVLGHAMEQYLYLREKYHCKIVVNNDYAVKNTHSSVYCARDYLKNSYVCCADNWFPHNLFHAYQFHTLYTAQFLADYSPSEYGIIFNKDNLITSVYKQADHQWIMNGLSYFDRFFSQRFKDILEKCIDDPKIKKQYWEDIYSDHISELSMYAEKYPMEEVVEFDSVADLEVFDPDYIINNPLELTDTICRQLQCSPSDLSHYAPCTSVSGGRAFTFCCRGVSYRYEQQMDQNGKYLPAFVTAVLS